MKKYYEVSFSKICHTSKPEGKEIGKISNSLYTKSIDYKELAIEVGENGCTFSPAVYNGKRRKENYMGQQLIALDFDNGVTFAEIAKRAEHYRLPILFAYKTFSCTEEHEKFRVVFALSDVIVDSFTSEVVTAMFMKIFTECKVSSYSKEIDERNMLASGGWKCAKCGRVNPSYNTGSCVCGNSKMENEKIKTSKIKKDNITSEIQNIQKLKSYKELLDIGAISQEEFDAKKKELL